MEQNKIYCKLNCDIYEDGNGWELVPYQFFKGEQPYARKGEVFEKILVTDEVRKELEKKYFLSKLPGLNVVYMSKDGRGITWDNSPCEWFDEQVQ